MGNLPCNTRAAPASFPLAGFGLRASQAFPLAGDASSRRFFRVKLRGGGSVIVMWYPGEAAVTVRHHARVFRWAQSRRLPVPRLLAELEEALLVEDVGVRTMRQALEENPTATVANLLATLSSFQRQPPHGVPNPPFDSLLFWRELEQFLAMAYPNQPPPASVCRFCAGLAHALTAHPFRLCHRDFHLDNLLVSGAQIKAVDFQDMRLGPDTYDLASLLRERGGPALLPQDLVHQAAQVLQWAPGWQDRYWQCAAQRGMKALGTFLKLIRQGRRSYGAFVDEVAGQTLAALEVLRAPRPLRELLAGLQERPPV
ncbi:MAG: phosphotransferase [Thermoanaerobaculum sp.]|nr:phosphotransferase [Thermoanaerobaculum sp.]